MKDTKLAVAVALTLAAASPFAEQTQTGGNWVYNTSSSNSSYLRAYNTYSYIVDLYKNLINKYSHYSWFSRYRARFEKAVDSYSKRRDFYKSKLGAVTWTKKKITNFKDVNDVEAAPVLINTKEEKFKKSGYNWKKVTNTYSISTTTTTKVWDEHLIYYSDGSTKKEIKNSRAYNTVSIRKEVEKLNTRLEKIVEGIVREADNEAHRQGYTGAGVEIAILDTGLSGGEGIRLNTSYNFKERKVVYDHSGDVTDGHGHGTHVAGIAKSLAYNSDILAVKVCTDTGRCNPNDVLKGLSYSAAKGSKVVNMSLGGIDFSNYTKSKYYTLPALKKLKKNGSFVAVAAGNSGYSCKDTHFMDKYKYLGVICSWPAALPAHEELKEFFAQDLGWVAVGAVDENNAMPSWSNKAGIMKDFYLVAPGVDIESDWKDGTRKKLSGTSMASPQVAGTAALLLEKYPHLKGKSIQDIILWTADDLGDVGVDEIFGHGKLNVGRAFTEGDELLIDGKPAKNYKAGTIVASGAFGGTLNNIAGLSSVALTGSNGSYEGDFTPEVVGMAEDFNFSKFEEVEVGNTILGFTRDENNVISNPMLGYRFDNVSLKVTAEDTLVGAEASFIEDANSVFANVSYSEGLFEMDATFGRGTASLTEDTLISDISSVNAFGASIKYGNELWAGAEKPLSITKGSVTTMGNSHSLKNSAETIFKVGYDKTTEDISLSTYLDNTGEKNISFEYKF